MRLIVFITASLLVGAQSRRRVGRYVGIVVPHLVDCRWGATTTVIPAAALTGAVFVVVADTIARTVIAPRELPSEQSRRLSRTAFSLPAEEKLTMLEAREVSVNTASAKCCVAFRCTPFLAR